MSVLVDIIIPAYNAQDTIRTTLDSIVKQTARDKIHICIIDDCSNLKYNAICDEYRDRISITLYRLRNNGGPGLARQKGLDNTYAKYVMFIDSDDFITDDNAVETFINTMESENCDAVSSIISEDDYGNVASYYVGFDTLHGKMYRRSFLKENNIKFPNTYNSEDLAFNNMVLINTDNLRQVDINAYTYKRRINSLTQTDDYISEKHIRCVCENLKYVMEYAIEKKIDKAHVAALLRSNFCYFYCYFGGSFDVDENIRYIYDLIPYYNKYEKYYNSEVGHYWLRFWIIRVEQTHSEDQYEKFISRCKKKYKEITNK